MYWFIDLKPYPVQPRNIDTCIYIPCVQPEMKLIYWFEVISYTALNEMDLLIWSHILYCLKWNWYIDLKSYPVLPYMKLIYWFEAISCTALNELIYWFEAISCTALNEIDLLIWSHMTDHAGPRRYECNRVFQIGTRGICNLVLKLHNPMKNCGTRW